jgi:hypothetical protein
VAASVPSGGLCLKLSDLVVRLLSEAVLVLVIVLE